ncbi:hypothetical protein BDR22DRAFT_821420 [Usnea florida]
MYLLAAVAAFCACAIYYNPTHLVEAANAPPVLLLRHAIETADALDPHLKMVNKNLFETLPCLLKGDPPQLTLAREITTVTSGLKAANAAILYELNASQKLRDYYARLLEATDEEYRGLNSRRYLLFALYGEPWIIRVWSNFTSKSYIEPWEEADRKRDTLQKSIEMLDQKHSGLEETCSSIRQIIRDLSYFPLRIAPMNPDPYDWCIDIAPWIGDDRCTYLRSLIDGGWGRGGVQERMILVKELYWTYVVKAGASGGTILQEDDYSDWWGALSCRSSKKVW